jgi:CheY-like chemotaxis protein
MSLILAIEPDRQQATELAAMVRGRLRAELILADSAEPALAALGDRVPDLILTSALLSTKDEAALADRLRKLEGAAAHVQTLTIPVLDTPMARSAAGRNVLFGLLGDRMSSPAAPDGCDPALFAEQCAEYLQRAAAERTGQPVDVPVAMPLAPAPVMEPTPPPEPVEAPVAAAPPSPPPAVEAIEDVVEIDLSGMLDESVFQQLSEAIETVSRDSARVQAAPAPGIEAWKPSSLGSAAVWPAMNFTPGDKSGGQRPANTPAAPKRFPDRKPLQDEWGFFDPAQCGFSALLAKLDEITHVASPLSDPNRPAGPSERQNTPSGA